tara:strand:+ start:2010 stop:2207 length:198 start_codon:yes stop_codon:yes gene_type:complete
MSDQNTKSEMSKQWDELKKLVESLELDVAKNISGNKSAGTRARKGLRQLKQKAADVVKVSLESDR